MLLEDPKHIKTQGLKMFVATPDPKRPEFSHLLMQVALLDRLVWCCLPWEVSNIRRNTAHPKKDGPPENAQSLITACQDWQSTLAHAAIHILTYEKAENDPELVKTTTSLGPDSAVNSLGLRLAQSKNGVLVNHIEQNFISAAIALRALVEVNPPLFLICNSETHFHIFLATLRT